MAVDFPFRRTRGYGYRPLKLRADRDNPMKGWDVYALQTGLRGLGLQLKADGIFGPRTDAKVRDFQSSSDLVVDGIAGIATQRVVGLTLAMKAGQEHNLPAGIPHGHVEKECGWQLGNYTPPYEMGVNAGSRDMGAVQMNSRFWEPIIAFDTPVAIDRLASQVEAKWADYDQRGIVSMERALELACGSWNAPGWTDTLARGGTISSAQLEWIEAYIERVMAYA